MKKIKYIVLSVILILAAMLVVKVIVTGSISFADDMDMVKETINVNEDQRTFYVHLPEVYRKEDKKLPVVIIFHGTVADANKIKNYTKFNDFANKKGIIVVYPEYIGNFDWDLKPAEHSKDIKFTSKMVDFLVKNYKVDKSRIYAAGYSSGAEMNYLLACTLPDKIAAFAPVCGNMRKSYVAECRANKPVPILLVHGTGDPYEKWDGNPLKEMISVDEVLNFWKNKNKCSGKYKETVFPHKNPAEESLTTAQLYVNDTCKNNSEVSILKIEGGGHTWPGSPTSVRIETFLGKTNYDVEGNDIIWDFFSKHHLN